MCREVNRIAIAIWATVKHITVSLEDKEDDLDKEIFYNPSSKPIKEIFC